MFQDKIVHLCAFLLVGNLCKCVGSRNLLLAHSNRLNSGSDNSHILLQSSKCDIGLYAVMVGLYVGHSVVVPVRLAPAVVFRLLQFGGGLVPFDRCAERG